jgi:hypothetical protein
MKTLNGNNPTLIIRGFFRKRYYLYIPHDGIYALDVFSLAQQKQAKIERLQAQANVPATSSKA